MAVVDNLEISIKSEIASATKDIDKLIGKIGELSNSIKSINVSNISSQVSKLTTSFKNINGGGFSELNKAVKEAKGSISSIVDASGKVLTSINNTSKGAELSLNRVSNAAKKVSGTKLTFNTSDYNKAIQRLSAKFSEIGKDFKASDNLKQLEKQSSKLSTELDKLSQKEQKIISIGRVAPDSTGFIGLQYNISKTVNELGILTDKINQLKSTTSGTSGIKIIRGDSAITSLEYLKKELQNINDLMQKTVTQSQIETFVSNLETGLGRLKQSFPEQTQLIEEYKNKIESLKNLSVKIPEVDARNSFKGIPEAARYSTQEAQRTLNEAMSQVHAQVPTEQFRNYTKEIAEAAVKLKELEAAGKGMGHPEWDAAHISLQRLKSEAEAYKKALNNKANGLDADTQAAKTLREQLKQLQIPEIKENNLDKLQNQLEKTKQKMASLKTELQNKLTMGKITASVDDSGYVRMREQIALTGKTISALQDRIKVFSEASEKVTSLGNRIEELKSHINNLQSQGFKAGDTEFDKAAAALQRTEQELKQYKAILAQPSKGLDEDINKTNSLGNRVEELRKKLDELKGRGLNFGDKEFDKAYSELQKAEGELSKYKSSLNNTQKSSTAFADKTAQAFSKISNAAKNMVSGATSALGRFGSALTLNRGNLNNLTNGMSSFRNTTSKTISSVGSLTKQIAAASGVYLGLYGAIKGIKSSIDFASSLTEAQNVINVTFGKSAKIIEDFTETSIQKFGLSALSAKQTAGRYQAMGTALGLPQKEMAKMSVELTKLSADMASFYDVAQSDVAKSLQSVFTGTTAPMRRYGVDLTVTTLEEWAHKRGIDAKIKSMSQAEKMMLRYAYVMERTGAAQKDFQRTILTWHNQTTLLKENFRELSGVIGTVFINSLKPVVIALNNVMGKVIAFSKTVLNSLGKIFGWTYEDTGGGVVNDFADEMEGAEDLSDSMDDVADSTDKATKKQKEFNKQFSKLDELINYTTSEKGGKDKDKDDGGADVGDLADLGGEYGAGGEWKKSKSIFKEFESELDSLYKLGDYISGALADAMEKIDWDKIYKKAEGFGTGLANFLNGLFTGEKGAKLFEETGKLIGNSLNTALKAVYKFAKKFKWEKFGENLAKGLKSFFGNFDWELGVKTFNTLANGILDGVIGALDEISISDLKKVAEKIAELIGKVDVSGISFKVGKIANKLVQDFYTLVSNKDTWKNLGKQIANGINNFFKGMGQVDPETGLNGWEALGKGITDSISGILTTITTALNGVHWEEVGQAIADLISNIDTGKIMWNLGKLVSSLANAFYVLVSKRDTWKLLGQKIADGVNGFFSGMNDVDPKTGLTGWQALGKSISDTILGIGDMIITALDGVDWESVGQAIADFITSIDWGGIIWKLGEVVASFAEALKKLLSGTGIPKPLANLIVNVGIGGWIIKKLSKTALGAAITGKLGKKFAVALLNVGARIKSWIASAVNKTGLISKITKAVGKITTTLKNVGAKIASWAITKVANIKTAISKVIGKVAMTLKNVAVTIKGWLVSAATSIADKIRTMIPSRVNANRNVDIGANWNPIGLDSAISTAIKGFGSFGISLLVTDIIAGDDAWKNFLGDNSSAFKQYMNSSNKYTSEEKEKIKEFEETSKPFWKFIVDGISGKGWEMFNKDTTGTARSDKTTVDNKEVAVKYKADTSELDKVTASDKDATVRYRADTKELQEANKLADADHENTTTFKTSHKELDKVIEKALKDIENITKFGTNTSSLDEAIAKAKKDRSNETTFKGKEGKSLKEKIEEAEANHENTTKFYADPAQKFIQMTKNWQTFKDNKEITTSVKFKATGDISKINSIINNVLIPSEKKFKITLDVATEGMGSAAVTNLPWNKNKHAKGSTGLPADELGVVNDQSGNTYKELVIPPHGTPFIPEGRNVTLAMEKGTRIIPADKTKKFLNSLPHFANGTEDFDSDKKSKGGNSIAAGVSQAINDTLMPYIKEIVRALKNGGGTTVTTSGKKTTTKYSDTVKEIQAAWLSLAKWFEDTVAKPIEKTFQTLKEQLLNVFDATNKELTEKYGEYAAEWQDTLKEIPEWLKENVGDTIVEKFEELCSGLTEGLSGAWEEMQGVLSSIPGWVESNVTSPFQGNFTSMFENIQGEHERLWDTIYSYSDKKLGELETRLDNINSRITSAKAEAESIQAEINSKTFDKITETITNAADALSKPGGIQQAVQAATGKTTAGKYIPSQTAKEEEKKEKTYHDSFVYWTPDKDKTSKESDGNVYTFTDKITGMDNKKTTTEKLSSMTTPNHTFETIKDATGKAMERVADIINKNFSVSNIADKLKVKRYAAGGFPEDGWFRASKGEFMGQFDDGTSYVANNQQIQKAISAEVGGAVYNAVMAAMVNSNNNNGGDIVVNVDGESLFKIIKNKDNMMYNRTGKGAFEH